MPDRNRFTGPEHLYSTLLHELAHWSGAAHRLDRKMGDRFGDKSYAMEELVTELTASFLCADLDVLHDPAGNTADYVAHWITVLKSDKKAIFTAAVKARAAADFLKPRPGSE